MAHLGIHEYQLASAESLPNNYHEKQQAAYL